MSQGVKNPHPTSKPEFSDADKERARQWFKKAADSRSKQNYDYAVECYITGLSYWPEAVEDGHMPLRSLAVQRQQAGGKKPGLMEKMKKSLGGKDFKQNMLSAEHLMSLDPTDIGSAEAVLRNATKLGYLETAKWVAPLVYDGLKKDKKPDRSRLKKFREALVEAAEAADAQGENGAATWFLDHAVSSLEYLLARVSMDEELRNEQRDLAGKLTIARGKYQEADSFRDSLQDADKQKRLHDTERVKQGEQTLDALLEAARRDMEAAPNSPGKINAYVDVLLREERPEREDEAMRVLRAAYERTQNYSFKLRADDVHLHQLTRSVRALLEQARRSGTEEDRQQHRLARSELRQTMLEVYRERVANYPTDLKWRYRLGTALFDSGEYDQAIPELQAASGDPRNRVRCQALIGRSFLEKGSAKEAAEILTDALAHYELMDDFAKEMLYWLGRAHEAAGHPAEARDAYGRLLRVDYNYLNGEARTRMEALR